MLDDADQMHDVKVHWLDLEMITDEEDIMKELLLTTVEDADKLHDANVISLELVIVSVEEEAMKKEVLAVKLQYVNVHWLEFAIVAGEAAMAKA